MSVSILVRLNVLAECACISSWWAPQQHRCMPKNLDTKNHTCLQYSTRRLQKLPGCKYILTMLAFEPFSYALTGWISICRHWTRKLLKWKKRCKNVIALLRVQIVWFRSSNSRQVATCGECVTWLIYMCESSHTFPLWNVWHDSVIHVTQYPRLVFPYTMHVLQRQVHGKLESARSWICCTMRLFCSRSIRLFYYVWWLMQLLLHIKAQKLQQPTHSIVEEVKFAVPFFCSRTANFLWQKYSLFYYVCLADSNGYYRTKPSNSSSKPPIKSSTTMPK